MRKRYGRYFLAPALGLAGVVFACSSTDSATTDAGAPDGTAEGSAQNEGGPNLDDASFFRETAAPDVGATDGGIFNEGSPDVGDVAVDACLSPDAGAPPFPRRCAPPTASECDNGTDAFLTSQGVSAALKNATTGNGYDDDCDGLVDEGCACPGNGQTKDCYLVPATQIDVSTKKPVGWCTDNSKGSLDCAGNEFPKWSGTCRGAQPPYAHDVCAPGDFNCDGLPQNSDIQDCRCKIEPVTCPTTSVVEAPYPNPKQIALIDGSQWIVDPNQRANATGWAWTIVGGDCDNVLPHPTFALYAQTDSTIAGARKGTRTAVKYDATLNPARYAASPGAPLQSIQAVAYGSGVAGGQIYPAFGLSGDYVVQGEFDLGGQHYVCTQKVQVRAPGIRAELCWDTVGGEPGSTGNDIDLHLARMQLKPGQSCAAPDGGVGAFGWDSTCKAGTTYEDCWWDPKSGCRDFSTVPPDWGYPDSPPTACLGWSSKRLAPNGGVYKQACTNPRLDKDNITCDPTIDDPTVVGTLLAKHFCGPENINLDNPNDGDQFAIGVNHFQNYGGTANAKPHVNIYCNGQRVLSVGYNPITGQTSFPSLTQANPSVPGADVSGDLWNVGTIKAHVAGTQLTSCDVSTIPSHYADPTRDGPAQAPNTGNQLCVESKSNASTPAWSYLDHRFVDHTALQGVPNGAVPAQPGQWCKH